MPLNKLPLNNKLPLDYNYTQYNFELKLLIRTTITKKSCFQIHWHVGVGIRRVE